MRHRIYGKHLGRTKNERSALFKNLVGALILHGSIETTEAKAKAIKGLVDKIITQAKSKNTQRLVSQFLIRKEVQEKLFKEIIPSVKNRNSGFTSVVKLGRRLGDKSMKVRMSLLMETPVIASEATPKAGEAKQSTKMEKIASSKTPRNDVKPRIRKSVIKKVSKK